MVPFPVLLVLSEAALVLVLVIVPRTRTEQSKLRRGADRSARDRVREPAAVYGGIEYENEHEHRFAEHEHVE